MNIQYITDEKGRHKAVIIPIKEWEEMRKEHKKIKNKLDALNGLADSLREIEDIKAGKKNKGRTLSEFLHEG